MRPFAHYRNQPAIFRRPPHVTRKHAKLVQSIILFNGPNTNIVPMWKYPSATLRQFSRAVNVNDNKLKLIPRQLKAVDCCADDGAAARNGKTISHHQRPFYVA